VKIELDHNNLFHALKKEAFHTSILDLELDGQTTKVVLRDVQFHPFKPWCCTLTSSAWTRTPRWNPRLLCVRKRRQVACCCEPKAVL
jgi:Ribosomal protein L25 (general stress protein Ctc)